ncbi:threonine synthase [Hyphococcus flavus]|uniref:Threonine synthase n=1 Tax=Hyphococcus flavus TaxID=1866326 RepID=A0AAE9ZBA9_9PROT|nr:threonine synthase [Hyphococcus flavus]WDI31418.1 threonine synthase [Hyphococcus flavus]
MEYISTRGRASAVDFEGALLAGLAPDGGLYMPEAWPRLTVSEARRIGEMPYAKAAAEILSFFAGDAVDSALLHEMTADAYGGFADPAVAPLRKVGDDDYILELFHGPTLAFKDFAMQILGRLFDAALTRRDETLTIIVATSGDTGSAAIEALKSCARVNIVVLHPEGRVSEVQRRMMTSVIAPNVCNIAVDGSFDDCQAIVKALFADETFVRSVRLGGVNSINWARLAAQTVYYYTAWASVAGKDEPVSFVVPTGNFGDVFAGYAAKKMGLPVAKLGVAANANDILHRAISKGDYTPATVRPTASPSMDIQVASNFERLLFEAKGRDNTALRDLMEKFSDKRSMRIDDATLAAIREDFVSAAVSEEETLAEIAQHEKATGDLIDPHTAVARAAAIRLRGEGVISGKIITLSTAHPAKFPEAVEQATGRTPALPKAYSDLFDRPEEMRKAPAAADAIKSIVNDLFAKGSA